MIYDTLIGFATFNLSSLIVNSEISLDQVQTDWFSVFYKNERIGHLKISSQFTPNVKNEGQVWE